MNDLVTRAQITMLAHTLDVDPGRLGHLERLGAEHLNELREQLSNALFDEQATSFSRVSRLAPLIPDALVAKLSQAFVPPLVAGRIAGALGIDHPGRIEGVMSRLSPSYMADCAPYIDPRAITVLTPIMPAAALVPAANELIHRHDYITASLFLASLTPELIVDLERGIDDDVGLLMTAALTEPAERLNEIIGILPGSRVRAIIAAATETPEAMLAGVSLLARLDDELTGRFAHELFDALDRGDTAALLHTILDRDAITELITVAASAGTPATVKLAGSLARTDRETRERFATIAAEHDLQQELHNNITAGRD